MSLFLLAGAICFAETDLELRVNEPLNQIGKIEKTTVDLKVFSEFNKFLISGLLLNGKTVGRNNVANINLGYDNGVLSANTGFETKRSNIGFFEDNSIIYSEAAVKMALDKHILTPRGDIYYFGNKSGNDTSFDVGIEYSYNIADKLFGVLNTNNKIAVNGVDQNVQEAGLQGKIQISDTMEFEPNIFLGHENVGDDVGDDLYIKSDLRLRYNFAYNIYTDVSNYNILNTKEGSKYITQKIGMLSCFEYEDVYLGKGKILLNASFNSKGIYNFTRVGVAGNKFIGNFEAEAGVDYRDSEVRSLVNYNVKVNYYITEINKVFVSMTKENKIKYIVTEPNNDAVEVGLVSMF